MSILIPVPLLPICRNARWPSAFIIEGCSFWACFNGRKTRVIKTQVGVAFTVLQLIFISRFFILSNMKIALGVFLLNLPLSWICLAGGDPNYVLPSLLAFYCVKGPVAWILDRKPKLKLPSCVLGICLTCSGTLWAYYSSNWMTDILRCHFSFLF